MARIVGLELRSFLPTTANSRHSPGNALEDMAAAILEGDPGADDEVLHGTRHEHLARAGERRDAGSEVDGKSRDVVG